MKIVILDGYTVNPGDLSWEGFAALGRLTVYDRTPFHDEAEILRRIGDAEIVYTNKTPLTKAIIDRAPGLKYIGVLATGYNVVDLQAAKARGIPVSNTPAYGTQAVGQFAIALLLEICSRVGQHAQAVREGRWQNAPDFCFWEAPLIELAGKTIGLIGLGQIGQVVGRIAGAMGMEVIAHSKTQTDAGREIARYLALEELLASADVISLHCPLFPETQGMINKDSIAKMKDGVIIINNSRGPLIVEQDLADALNSGKVLAAGLDVVALEPIRADNPLLGAKNCLITPHISWAPTECRQRLADIALGNLKSFLAGRPTNLVNP